MNPSVKGPCPDVCIWVGLFLGKDREIQVRNEMERAKEIEQLQYAVVNDALGQEAAQLSVLELARNILHYLALQADTSSPNKLLQFCATYGLSGAMSNVLKGKYGRPIGNLTMDALFPMDIEQRSLPPFEVGNLCLPAYAIGAVLGHCNVVRHSLQQLGARLDAPYGFERESGHVQEHKFLPTIILFWVIKTNQHEMVQCLVECGFQIRWLFPVMDPLFDMIFHIDRMGDEFGVWRSKTYDPDKYYMDSRTMQRKYRAHCCYQEKQKMLQTMIEAGMPFDLFIPQINLDREKKLLDDMREQGLQEATADMARDFCASVSKAELKARNKIANASAEYNVFQKGDKGVTLVDFFETHLMNMWKDQPTVQASRLSEFEKLDARWEKYEEKGEAASTPWWIDNDDSSYDDSEEDSY